MSAQLKIAFMGTPDFAVPALEALINSEHDVVCVYCQPPRPKGRGKKEQASPVQQCAEKHNIPVRHPVNFKDKTNINDFRNLNLDIAIVAAYGLILPKSILEAPKYGCLNIHASLLPRWRGAAPIHRAILDGDPETGVTIMQMDVGLDTGDMISKRRTPITTKTTLSELHDTLSMMGAEMVIECLSTLQKDKSLNGETQSDSESCYAAMLKKEDGRINWSNNASYIHQQIRALNPWPGSWCLDANNKRMKVLSAIIFDNNNSGDTMNAPGTILKQGIIQCGENTALSLELIQPENKKKMRTLDAINGNILSIGDIWS